MSSQTDGQQQQLLADPVQSEPALTRTQMNTVDPKVRATQLQLGLVKSGLVTVNKDLDPTEQTELYLGSVKNEHNVFYQEASK